MTSDQLKNIVTTNNKNKIAQLITFYENGIITATELKERIADIIDDEQIHRARLKRIK